MIKVLALAAAAMTVAGAAEAGDWYLTAMSGSGAQAADRRSAEYDGSKRKIWTIAAPPTIGADGVSYTLSQIEFDCPGRQFRPVTASTYGNNGQSITTEYYSDPWFPIPPESMGSTLHLVLCASGFPETGKYFSSIREFVSGFRTAAANEKASK